MKFDTIFYLHKICLHNKLWCEKKKNWENVELNKWHYHHRIIIWSKYTTTIVWTPNLTLNEMKGKKRRYLTFLFPPSYLPFSRLALHTTTVFLDVRFTVTANGTLALLPFFCLSRKRFWRYIYTFWFSLHYHKIEYSA